MNDMKVVMREAVLYARVSTPEQQREGYSIPAQIRLLEDYAVLNGIHIVSSHIDVETARKSGRTAFGEMLRYLRKRPQVRILLVEKTDRLYRNLKDWAIIDELGLEIHFVKENAVMSQDCRSSEKFVHGIKVLMAKAYIDNLSEETRKGMREKAQQGIWPSVAPIGYLNVVDPAGRRTIAIDPEQGPLVARLFDWYSTGAYSVKSLTAKARQAGLRYRKSGKPIGTATVHNMLRNRIYTGRFDWLDTTYDGVHEPLTSSALWEAVQNLLDGRNHANVHTLKGGFPFHGLVKCGHCECSLVCEIKKGRYIYYHCSGYRGKCPEPFLRQEKLEERFVKLLQRFRCSPGDFARLQRAVLSHDVQPTSGEAGKIRRMRVGALAENSIALLDMVRTAHLVLPSLPIALKRQLLALVLADCSWANDELTATFNAPFDQFADYITGNHYSTGEGYDGNAGERAVPLRLVAALAQPDEGTGQLIARYNAIARLQAEEAERNRRMRRPIAA
ncbi:MAG TPA: recombinase family protein [Sphingomonas sp.]|nr:recombinase family protein [Sphingomonas sp.]